MTESAARNNGALDFVGFGFGAVQAGLFLLEAQRSGAFRRLVVAEVDPKTVASVRADGGSFGLNVAHSDRVESTTVGPVELENPSIAADRERIIEAIAGAGEIATAIPSVKFYEGPGEGSVHRLLAAGLRRRAGRPTVVYAAENHTRAAEILAEAVLHEVPEAEREGVSAATRFVNTVIGKMSAVITDQGRIRRQDLRPVTGGDSRAFLVEAFRHILISSVGFPDAAGHRRGLAVFEEKSDLRPFEEAKLYGHNAIHALAAYLAARRGLDTLADLDALDGAVEFLRTAFLEEIGDTLCARWSGADPLFSPAGFREHADDLLQRMLNPHLGDLVERVARDPERKLGWDDRLVGSLRLALAHGLRPRRLALGAALALVYLRPDVERSPGTSQRVLEELWAPSRPDGAEAARVVDVVEEGLETLRREAADDADVLAG